MFLNLLKKEKKASCSKSPLRYDLHSHLLPGVDDGVESIEEGFSCIQSLQELGYFGAVITPHIFPEVFDNTEYDLRARFIQFKNLAAKYFPNFELELGAEYFFDESLLNKLEKNHELLVFGKSDFRWMLIEFPVTTEPFMVRELIDLCFGRKIQPILAHVERYEYLHNKNGASKVFEWKRKGALCQMDLGSIISQYGSAAKNLSEELLKNNLIDFLGTDLHRHKQVERFIKPALAKINEKLNYAWQKKSNHQMLL